MKTTALLKRILLLMCIGILPAQAQQLKFGADKKFKIVQFTEANDGTPLPALSFFHIPLPEFHEAVRHEDSFLIGIRKEEVCSPQINTGLFAAMLESGDALGIFVGHDHVNDYAVSWKGIMLCYGRFTGGKTVYHDIPGGNGARVIELTEGIRQFRSWIRLKDGCTVNDFTFPTEWVK